MLKFRMKRKEAMIERTFERLASVEASITALGDEDLLDFADIFVDRGASPLRDIAEGEMRRRRISL